MKRTILFCGLMSCALVAGAEARSWGFDKDTVYEWKAGGDTVRLVNNGVDTVSFDSLFVQEEAPYEVPWMLSFDFFGGRRYFSFQERRQSAGPGVLSPGQISRLSVFDVYGPTPVLAKGGGSVDTLRFRLVLSSPEGHDTLICLGIVEPTTSIIPEKRATTLHEHAMPSFDLLGRVLRKTRLFEGPLKGP